MKSLFLAQWLTFRLTSRSSLMRPTWVTRTGKIHQINLLQKKPLNHFSEIPLRLSLHCIQLSDVPDGETNQQTLREFSSRGRSEDRWNQLRMSADVAILLVDSYSDFANCGSNYFWALQSGRTLGTVSRSCIIK